MNLNLSDKISIFFLCLIIVILGRDYSPLITKYGNQSAAVESNDRLDSLENVFMLSFSCTLCQACHSQRKTSGNDLFSTSMDSQGFLVGKRNL